MSDSHIRRGRNLRIVVKTTALAILLLAGSASALSNSGGGSWLYNRDIMITNTGDDLTNYQVLVNLAGSKFPDNARSDGADIRFTDAGGNELSYWIEEWDYGNRSAKVWVNVTNIPAGVVTIRIYYGNSKAVSGSNGEATFVFFDDFSGDLSKWDVANAIGTWGIENGEVSGTMSGATEACLFADKFSIENGIVEYKYRYLLDGTAAGIQVRSSNNARSAYSVMFFDHGQLNVNYIQSYKNGVMSENKVDFTSAVNTYYNAKLEFNGASIKGTLDTLLNQRTLDWSQTGTFGLILLYGIENGHQHWDDIRVRKYASSEPTLIIDTEQSEVPPIVPPTPAPIPEFPTIILPVVYVIGIIFLIGRKKML